MGNVFEWGWSRMPMVTRILIVGVFLSILALTTPFWAYIRVYELEANRPTFGLWHFCADHHCNSIHDNLVPGRDVPVWYHMTQVCYTIGCICSAIPMFVCASHHEGRYLRMPATLNQMMVLMLLAGILQMCTALYTFVTYFDHTNFLYEQAYEVDFHGSFYCGIGGAISLIVGTGILFFDSDITSTKVRRREISKDPFGQPKPLHSLLRRPEPKVKRLQKDQTHGKRQCQNILDQIYLASQVQNGSIPSKMDKKKIT